MTDDITRSPELEAALNEVWALAAADARAGRDPWCPPRLAHLTDEYDARYTEVLCEMAAAKEGS